MWPLFSGRLHYDSSSWCQMHYDPLMICMLPASLDRCCRNRMANVRVWIRLSSILSIGNAPIQKPQSYLGLGLLYPTCSWCNIVHLISFLSKLKVRPSEGRVNLYGVFVWAVKNHPRWLHCIEVDALWEMVPSALFFSMALGPRGPLRLRHRSPFYIPALLTQKTFSPYIENFESPAEHQELDSSPSTVSTLCSALSFLHEL